MGDYYDNPEVDEVLMEQESCLPNGPLGTLIPPKIELIEDLPEEAITVLKDYLDGRLPTMDFVNKIETIKNEKFIVEK